MKEKIEHIVSMRIPDSDIPGWMKTLREAGMSPEEIDHMLSRLNETYKTALENNEKAELRPIAESMIDKFTETPVTGKAREEAIEEITILIKDELGK